MKNTYRNFILAALGTCAFFTATAQKQIEKATGDNLFLTVNLSKLSYPVQKLFFSYYNTTTKFRFIDSAVVGTEKIITFKTKIEEPLLAQLRVVPVPDSTGSTAHNHGKRDYYSIFIEPGKLTAVAKDSLGNTSVTGSASHKDYLVLKAKEAPYDSTMDNLYKEYTTARKNKDSVAQQTVEHKIDSVDSLVKENVYKTFAVAYAKKSPVALYALAQYSGYSINPVKAQPLYNLLAPSVKNLPAGIAFAKRIEVAKQLQIGQPALAFTQTDTLGNPVSLASFKGKYVLVDFWASWCGPCRAENPNVVKAFNSYKDKDFTVLGVSLDRPGQKEKWLKAIHDDGLAWTHVSDLKFWDNEVAQLYDVKAIPQNFLIDKEGKIVARDIRGEELQTTLQQLVK